jgi:formate-dependent phosphoribosylglycinamide formyltransferase (GAR transformylase)
MSTVALVLPTGGYRGPDFVAAAEELGIDLLVLSDGTLGYPGGVVSDVVVADCSDTDAAAEALVEAAGRRPVDAVVGVDDQGVLVAAAAAVRLGLPHNPVGAVAATRDKAAMRRLLDAAGVPQPRFAVVGPDDDPHEAAEAVGFPVVIKPVSLSASRGVIRVDGPAAVAPAVRRIEAILAEAGKPLRPLHLEGFVTGPEVAVEALATPSGLELLAIFDKPDPLDGPFFEETIYTTPSRHPQEALDEVERVVARAMEAIGLVHGPVHAEARLSPDGVVLIEAAARSIGGLCGRSLRFGMLRQSLEVLLLRAALGLPRRGMDREDAAAGVMMLPIPADGVLRGVRGVEAVAEVPGITSLEITVPIGRRIRPLPEGDRYLGFLFAEGEQAGEVEAALREGHSLLDVIIEPV